MQQIGKTASQISRELLENSGSIAKPQEKNSLTHGVGSEMVDTRKIIPTAKPTIQAKGLAQLKAQAQSIKLLMQQKKPNRLLGEHKRVGVKECAYGKGDPIYKRAVRWEFPEMTDYERYVIEQNRLGLNRDTIIDYLARYLSIAKDMRVSEDRRAYRFADDADVLSGYPEYAIALGIIDLIEEDESNWYPPVSKLKKAVEANLVAYPQEAVADEVTWIDV